MLNSPIAQHDSCPSFSGKWELPVWQIGGIFQCNRLHPDDIVSHWPHCIHWKYLFDSDRNSSAQPSTSCGCVWPVEERKALILMAGVTLFRACRFLPTSPQSECYLWPTHANLISFSPKCTIKPGITWVLLLLISKSGQSQPSECLCGLFFFPPPLWPPCDEKAAPEFWHHLSLHIRPLWWRLSARRARVCPWLINPPRTRTLAHICLTDILLSFSLNNNPPTHNHLPVCHSPLNEWDEQIRWVHSQTAGASNPGAKNEHKRRHTHNYHQSYCFFFLNFPWHDIKSLQAILSKSLQLLVASRDFRFQGSEGVMAASTILFKFFIILSLLFE